MRRPQILALLKEGSLNSKAVSESRTDCSQLYSSKDAGPSSIFPAIIDFGDSFS